jgi:hypothetical protein
MIISLIFLANFAQADTKVNCQSALAKLKPSCNVVGDALKKMKKFSAENQTLGDTYKNIKNKKSK